MFVPGARERDQGIGGEERERLDPPLDKIKVSALCQAVSHNSSLRRARAAIGRREGGEEE